MHLCGMVNYFELYGLPVTLSPDPAVVKSKFYELSRKFHPDRFTLAAADEQAEALQMSSANNEAYKVLKDPYATLAYVLKLNNVLEDEEKYSLPPTFLMEMMDLNEALSDYEMDESQTGQLEQARSMLNGLLTDWERETAPLSAKYDGGDHSDGVLQQLKEQYFRKKYLLRIQERINSFAAR